MSGALHIDYCFVVTVGPSIIQYLLLLLKNLINSPQGSHTVYLYVYFPLHFLGFGVFFKPVSQDLVLLQCWHSCDANICLLSGGTMCTIPTVKGLEIFRI